MYLLKIKIMQLLPRPVLFLTLAFALSTGCKEEKNDPPPSSQMTVNGKEYTLDKGWLENYGDSTTSGISHEGTNLDLLLMTSGIQLHLNSNGEIDSVSGEGYSLYFQMFSNNSTDLSTETYRYRLDGTTGTFNVGDLIPFKNGNPMQALSITEGSVHVRKENGNYIMSANLVAEDTVIIDMNYYGKLTYIDKR